MGPLFVVPFVSDHSRLGKRKKIPAKKNPFSPKCIFRSVSGLMAPHLDRLPSFWGRLTCPGESETGYPRREFGLMLKRCWRFPPLRFRLCCVTRGARVQCSRQESSSAAAAWQLLTDTSAFSGGPHCIAEERGASRGGWAHQAGEGQSISKHF